MLILNNKTRANHKTRKSVPVKWSMQQQTLIQTFDVHITLQCMILAVCFGSMKINENIEQTTGATADI